MAIIEAINSKANLKSIIDYVTQDKKTNVNLVTGKDCLAETCLEQMQYTKEYYKKNDGRQYLHIVQSFNPNDDITPHQVHGAGLKLAEQFKGFQVLVATHIDRGHLHNHLIVNSVNFENGYKIQMSQNDLQQLKDYSDEICIEIGASVIPKKEKTNYIKRSEYRAAEQKKSWKFRLISAIDISLAESKSKEEFIVTMKKLGYDVNWTDTRKYVTYTTPEGYKCRDNKLYDEKYLKGAMEDEFRRIEKEQSNCTREPSSSISSTDELLFNRTRSNQKFISNGANNFGEYDSNAKVNAGNQRKNNWGEYSKQREYGEFSNSKNGKPISKNEARTRENGRKTEKRYYPSKYQGRSISILDGISTVSSILSAPQINNDMPKRKIKGFRNLSKQAQKEYAIEQANASSIDWEEESEM